MLEIKHQIVECNPCHTYFHITDSNSTNDGVKFVIRNDGHIAIMTCKVIEELNNLYYSSHGFLSVNVIADYNLKDSTVKCKFLSDSTVNYSDNKYIVKDVEDVTTFAVNAWRELLISAERYSELESAIRKLKLLFEKNNDAFERVNLMIEKESVCE